MNDGPLEITPLERTEFRGTWIWFNQLVSQNPGIVERDPLTYEAEVQFLERQLEAVKQQQLVSLLAKQEDTVVAKLDIRPLTRYIDRHVGEVSFGVLAGHDGAGVRLIEAGAAAAARLDLEVLVYYILSTNHRYVACMQEAGFETVGRIERFYKRDGAYCDRIVMQRVLTL